MLSENKTNRGYDLAANRVRRLYDARISGATILDSELLFPDAPRFVAAWPQLRLEKGLLKRIVSSRSGLVEIKATGVSVNASMRRI